MSKTTHLIKNAGILAIGSFSSKLMVFLLVPLYTAVLTAAEYGAYDLIYSSIALLTPILTLNVADALLRFPLDPDADIPRIARVAIMVTMASGIIVLIGQFVPGAPWSAIEGISYASALYCSSAMYQLLVTLARGCDRMVDVAVAGVISALTMGLLNVVLLLCLKWGLRGFFIANIVGLALPAAVLLVRLRDVVFAPSRSNDAVLLSMVRYSIPLAMTLVGWWFINTSGRYIVTIFCGIDANGLYSVAFKIPAILSTVAGIFLQSWQVSAVKEFDPDDSDGFLSRTFETVEMLLVLLCSVVIIASPFVAFVMFSGEFYDAWIYVPHLTVLALLNTMGGMFGPFFSARYDTAPMATSTVLGGAVNIILGVLLVGFFGVWGVVAANVAGGAINWAYRGIKARNHVNANFHLLRSALLYAVLVLQGCVLAFGLLSLPLRLALSSLFLVLLVIFYRRQLDQGLRLARDFIRMKRHNA